MKTKSERLRQTVIVASLDVVILLRRAARARRTRGLDALALVHPPMPQRLRGLMISSLSERAVSENLPMKPCLLTKVLGVRESHL